jgi:hypothetical protein
LRLSWAILWVLQDWELQAWAIQVLPEQCNVIVLGLLYKDGYFDDDKTMPGIFNCFKFNETWFPG